MKSRYNVSDLPHLLFIGMLDAIEVSVSTEFDTTVSEHWVDDAAALLPGAEIWKARRDE